MKPFISFQEKAGCSAPVVVQSLSRVWLFATPRTAARQASLSFTTSRSLLKFMSIESVMPSNHLILCCPLVLLPSIFPSTSIFSNELALCIRSKYSSLSFSDSPFNEYSGLISFRIDWFDLRIHFCQGCHAQSCTRAWQETLNEVKRPDGRRK